MAKIGIEEKKNILLKRIDFIISLEESAMKGAIASAEESTTKSIKNIHEIVAEQRSHLIMVLNVIKFDLKNF